MDKYCTNCGKELGAENFCSNCGCKVNVGTFTSNRQDFVSKVQSSEAFFNSKYITVMLFSIITVLFTIFNWFSLSVPGAGKYKASVYSLPMKLSKLKRISSYMGGGADSYLTGATVVAYIILGICILLIYLAAKTVFKAFKSEAECTDYLKITSITGITLSASSVLYVIIIRLCISNAAGEYAGFVSSALEEIITFTALPIILAIISVIGIVVSKKISEILYYEKIEANKLTSKNSSNSSSDTDAAEAPTTVLSNNKLDLSGLVDDSSEYWRCRDCGMKNKKERFRCINCGKYKD